MRYLINSNKNIECIQNHVVFHTLSQICERLNWYEDQISIFNKEISACYDTIIDLEIKNKKLKKDKECLRKENESLKKQCVLLERKLGEIFYAVDDKKNNGDFDERK